MKVAAYKQVSVEKNIEKGFVAIYVKFSCTVMVKNNLQWLKKYCIEGVCEFAGIEIKLSDVKIILVAIYRLPNADFKPSLITSLLF